MERKLISAWYVGSSCVTYGSLTPISNIPWSSVTLVDMSACETQYNLRLFHEQAFSYFPSFPPPGDMTERHRMRRSFSVFIIHYLVLQGSMASRGSIGCFAVRTTTRGILRPIPCLQFSYTDNLIAPSDRTDSNYRIITGCLCNRLRRYIHVYLCVSCEVRTSSTNNK
jgi:hypothetical protein